MRDAFAAVARRNEAIRKAQRATTRQAEVRATIYANVRSW